MKRIIFLTATISCIFTLFTACVKEEFMDLYDFTQRLNYPGITIESFLTEKDNDGCNVYYCFFEKEKACVMLKIISNEENKINETRIYLAKYDENANAKPISTEEISLFAETVHSVMNAFTGFSEEECEEIVSQMRLYDKKTYSEEGELTKDKDNFKFVYHSASLGSEFTIYNTYLKDPEPTEKPVSRPLFAENPKIRTETAPAK